MRADQQPAVPDLKGPGVRALFDGVRELVLTHAPEAIEKHYPRNKTVCFDLRRTDDFVYINITKAGVNVGFFYGVELFDPGGVLQGSGARMRHVKVRRPDDLDTPELTALLIAARDRAMSAS